MSEEGLQLGRLGVWQRVPCRQNISLAQLARRRRHLQARSCWTQGCPRQRTPAQSHRAPRRLQQNSLGQLFLSLHPSTSLRAQCFPMLNKLLKPRLRHELVVQVPAATEERVQTALRHAYLSQSGVEQIHGFLDVRFRTGFVRVFILKVSSRVRFRTVCVRPGFLWKIVENLGSY